VTATFTQSPTATVTPTYTATPLPPDHTGAVIPIGDVPASFAGRTLEIGLFGPGDVVDCSHLGSAWLAVVGPDGQYHSFQWYAKADPGTGRTGDPTPYAGWDATQMAEMQPTAQAWTSGAPSWPYLAQPLTNVDPSGVSSQELNSSPISWEENEHNVPNGSPLKDIPGVMVAEDGQYFFDGSWLYIDVQIPASGYAGGYWKIEYVPVVRNVPNGGILSSDRVTMTLGIKGSPVHLVK